MENYVLIGMPGAGKSTIGVVLAKTLGMGFCDIDLIIQQINGRRLQNIIDEDGLDAFLRAEESGVCSVVCQNTVIATGGSVVLEEKSMTHLKSLGKIIYLRLDYSEIERRIRNITTRGIAFAKGQTLLDIYNSRSQLYERYADIVIDCNLLSFEQSVGKIIDALNN